MNQLRDRYTALCENTETERQAVEFIDLRDTGAAGPDAILVVDQALGDLERGASEVVEGALRVAGEKGAPAAVPLLKDLPTFLRELVAPLLSTEATRSALFTVVQRHVG